MIPDDIHISYKFIECVVQGGAAYLPALIYPVRRRMYILLFKLLVICMCLPVPYRWVEYWLFVLCSMYPLVVGSHMVGNMFNKIWVHEDMLFHKGGVCDTHENSGISCSISYIGYTGQCNLHNTCFGLLWVWYTPGGSMYRISYLIFKESIFTLIRSYWPSLSNKGLIKSCSPN